MKDSNDILANNLINLLKTLLKYWYVLVICTVITLGVAMFYLSHASKTYRVGASVLLRIENAPMPGGTNHIMRAFDFIVQDKTFQNEIYFIQSFPLIREVVDEMDFRVSYYMQERKLPRRFAFSWQNIYGRSPILVIPTEGHLQPVDLPFYINIIDDNYFYLSAQGESAGLLDFETEKIMGYARDFEINGPFRFGSLIETENVSFRVILNSNYNPSQYADKEIFFQFNNLNQVAAQLKGSLSIDGQGIESTMAELEIKTDNIAVGLHFLNALINKYIESNLEDATVLADKTIEHIDHQLMNVSDDLTQSEQQLQNLRRDHNVMNIEEKAQNIYQQLQTFQVQRDESQRRLGHLEQMKQYFQEQKDSETILAPSSLGLNDPMLNNLIQELTTLNVEKQRIISQDQLRSPRLATITNSIENLKNVINENITFSINTTQREIQTLNTQIASLNREFSALPSTQRELLGIERRFKLNDATYTSLLEKRLQAQIIKASKLPDAKIVEPPKYMGVWRPSRSIILALALLAGIGTPSLIILLKKLIDNRVASKEDVEMLTSIPVIASLPNNREPEENPVVNAPRTPIAEAFHFLRSNVVYYLHGGNKKVILLTSSMPEEGKSFTAINLASSFAQANSKTVLLEFDLRKPGAVTHVFGPRKQQGISAYLINKATLENIANRTSLPNLDIISAGQIPPNPVELISGARTRELFRELKEKYDYIIVDSPPFGLLTDAFLLMEHADLNLYMTRIGFSRKNILSSNLRDIERKKIKKLYVLINDIKIDMKGYGKYVYPEKKKLSGNLLRKKVAAIFSSTLLLIGKI